MKHPDPGSLRTWLDEPATVGPGVAEHVATCPRCAEILAGLAGRRDVVARALENLDVPAPTASARAAVHERVASPGARSLDARSRRTLRALTRAAGLVLLVGGGVAAAVPGSPLRSWIAAHVRGVATGSTESRAARPALPGGPGAGEVGIRVDVGQVPLRIVIRGLEAGGSLEVRWTGGDHVWIVALEGSRFRSAPGRVEADVIGRLTRVGLPRAVAATLEVDGRRYLRTGPRGPEVLQPTTQEDADGIRFRVPSR